MWKLNHSAMYHGASIKTATVNILATPNADRGAGEPLLTQAGTAPVENHLVFLLKQDKTKKLKKLKEHITTIWFSVVITILK